MKKIMMLVFYFVVSVKSYLYVLKMGNNFQTIYFNCVSNLEKPTQNLQRRNQTTVIQLCQAHKLLCSLKKKIHTNDVRHCLESTEEIKPNTKELPKGFQKKTSRTTFSHAVPLTEVYRFEF
jgi:hypothetical protein